jgi:hypothetical protein
MTMMLDAEVTDHDWFDVRLRVHAGAWLRLFRLLTWLSRRQGGIELVDVD